MRQFHKLVAIVGIAAIGVLGLSGGAGAATPNYSGTTTTTLASSGSTSSFTVAVGNSFSGQVCGFAPGATVTFTIDGTPATTAVAGSTGCAAFTATATDPHLAINGGTPVAVQIGTSIILASGASLSGAPITDTVDATVTTSSSSSSSGLAFTGADILAIVVGGLALIAFGFLVLTFVRRRVVTEAS